MLNIGHFQKQKIFGLFGGMDAYSVVPLFRRLHSRSFIQSAYERLQAEILPFGPSPYFLFEDGRNQ